MILVLIRFCNRSAIHFVIRVHRPFGRREQVPRSVRIKGTLNSSTFAFSPHTRLLFCAVHGGSATSQHQAANGVAATQWHEHVNFAVYNVVSIRMRQFGYVLELQSTRMRASTKGKPQHHNAQHLCVVQMQMACMNENDTCRLPRVATKLRQTGSITAALAGNGRPAPCF
jgi:hypothetical protein